MTEQEWMQAIYPSTMLRFLRGNASDRKLRLFSCGCCRRIWPLLSDWRSRKAVEVAERWIDGQASEEERWSAAQEARNANPSAATVDDFPTEHTDAAFAAAYCAVELNVPPDDPLAEWGMAVVTQAEAWSAACRQSGMGHDEQDVRDAVNAAQCRLLRCIFGPLPFHPVTIDPSWLTWHDGLLVSMARQMYESRDFTDMPILADALEEVGCDNPDILAHCRSGGEHARGCWVIDALLGKS